MTLDQAFNLIDWIIGSFVFVMGIAILAMARGSGGR
jgi:hypothetical protein